MRVPLCRAAVAECLEGVDTVVATESGGNRLGRCVASGGRMKLVRLFVGVIVVYWRCALATHA